MYKFNSISIGVMMALVLFLVILYIHLSNKEEEIKKLKQFDLNGDGVVTRAEVAKVVAMELEKKTKSPPKVRSVAKSMASGALRGCLMGLLLNGLEGAITGAAVLSVINPIVSGLEYML
jgi:uncharacterized membrane protein